MSGELTAVDILPGHVYEAKRPRGVGLHPTLLNDRQVTWVGPLRTEVQYDSPTIPNGRRYPTVSMTAFLNWAKRDITSEMPENRDWRKLK